MDKCNALNAHERRHASASATVRIADVPRALLAAGRPGSTNSGIVVGCRPCAGPFVRLRGASENDRLHGRGCRPGGRLLH